MTSEVGKIIFLSGIGSAIGIFLVALLGYTTDRYYEQRYWGAFMVLGGILGGTGLLWAFG